MQLLYATRPYEKTKGETDALYQKWRTHLRALLQKDNRKDFAKNVATMVKEFESIPIHDIQKPKVGLVGEILVKFHPTANNKIVQFIEQEGGEAVMPGMVDFFLFGFYNNTIKRTLLDGKLKAKIGSDIKIKFIEHIRKPVHIALKNSRYTPLTHIKELAQKASEVVSLGNISGEGWFLTAEMLELIHSGTPNIVCMQPFACLPNHVTGKGVMKELKRHYPKANIVAVDYDPGASEVNQINRIKLMLSVAHKNLANQ
ncbi:MAG: 2-hydroxyglutaryl-CoA dehydratase, partial [Firmicutes bacterium]|nr:2-hydroxyglutaryl-CoA dehydratase [Bacillota bacterium]